MRGAKRGGRGLLHHGKLPRCRQHHDAARRASGCEIRVRKLKKEEEDEGEERRESVGLFSSFFSSTFARALSPLSRRSRGRCVMVAPPAPSSGAPLAAMAGQEERTSFTALLFFLNFTAGLGVPPAQEPQGCWPVRPVPGRPRAHHRSAVPVCYCLPPSCTHASPSTKRSRARSLNPIHPRATLLAICPPVAGSELGDNNLTALPEDLLYNLTALQTL